MKDGYMLFGYDRKRTSTLTLDEQPGAHTGATRQYIPGYSDANIIYRAPTTGSDSNDGLTELTPKQTKSACDTAAGSTNKIRIIEACTLNESVSKPTEMKRGVSGSISSSLTAPITSLTAAATPGWTSGTPYKVTWWPRLSKWFAVGNTEIVSSSDGDTWTLEETLSGTVGQGIFYSQAHDRLYVFGTLGKVLYSDDGNTYSTIQFDSQTFGAMAYSDDLGIYVLGGAQNIYWSEDGFEWEAVPVNWSTGAYKAIYVFGKFYVFNGDGEYAYSANGKTWTLSNAINGGYGIPAAAYMEGQALLVVADLDGAIYTSPDGTTWTNRRSGSGSPAYDMLYIKETGYCVLCGPGRTLSYSANGTTWTTTGALTAYGASDDIFGLSYSVLRGRLMTVGGSGSTRVNAFGPLYGTTISADVAGFSLQAVQYSGTLTAYSCTLRQPGTTATLTLDGCRVHYDSHISNNAAKSRATLYIGDRHTTCTPAAQNDIDMNLDTVGGTWYIYNASQTGYERIRDCLVEGGIVASYNVTVSGRANVRGTSASVLFGATVTHRDPKFVDTTDYKLQFQSNGYARNSLAAGRSALYFNSAGDARDIGAWSYVESNVTYYFAKNVYIPKGEITHSVEEVVSEQQGDSGAVSVYGNVNRIKEVITIKYTTEKEADLNVVRAMRLLTDKTVLIQLDPEWDANPGSVVANGAHSVGDDVLNIDATATYNGLTVTIAGKKYYPLRMEPNATATTRLILDRPLEDSVADNDVITRNYPTGAGEYQYSAQQRLDLARVDATVMRAYRTGFIIRLVRAYQ